MQILPTPPALGFPQERNILQSTLLNSQIGIYDSLIIANIFWRPFS
jgi:hypothetical protein